MKHIKLMVATSLTLITHSYGMQPRESMFETVQIGQTTDPLITAILSENYERVTQALKEKNPNYFHATTKFTPLSLACAVGKIDIVKILLAAGAGPDYQDYDDQKRPQNTTAITEAARHGHLDIAIELIRHGANPNPQNPDNFTPLHAAARNGNPDIIRLLIAYNAHLDAQTNRDGMSALHESIPDLTVDKPNKQLESRKYQVSLILLQAGANPDLKTRYRSEGKYPVILIDKTALMIASHRQKKHHVMLLRLMGANPNIPDRKGALPDNYFSTAHYFVD